MFETPKYRVNVISEKDLDDILLVYNSNPEFLMEHMDCFEVTKDWLMKEIQGMIEGGFLSYKIIHKETNKIIGIIDVKIEEETYLSLLIIHSEQRNRGIGKVIYQKLEEYVKNKNSKSIRIDVVTSYDKSVYDFWLGNGFKEYDDIALNWAGKSLSAVVMKKVL